MREWPNFVGYQLSWLLAVAAAGRGHGGLAVLACAGFVAIELWRSHDRRADARLLLTAMCCGVLLDGALADSGWIRYASAAPGLAAPPWILALWAAFAMTMRHSLRWLTHHVVLALPLGAVGGPLAYLAAARGFDAVALVAPVPALALLAIGWAIAMPALATLARIGTPRAARVREALR